MLRQQKRRTAKAKNYGEAAKVREQIAQEIKQKEMERKLREERKESLERG